jgi:hypothetical protein
VSKKGGHYKKWEVALLFLASLLLASSAALYVSDISLRKYLLGWQDDVGVEQVGHVGTVTGTIRRQLKSEVDFEPVGKATPLFNQDTIVTGDGATAVLDLDDGGKIELGPNTMIRLSFESRLSLEGVSRAANVVVVAGEVKGQSKQSKIVLRTQGKEITIPSEKQEQVQVEAPLPRKPAPVPTDETPSPLPAEPSPSPSAAPSPSPSPAPSLSPSPSPQPQDTSEYQVKILAPKKSERLDADKGTAPPKKSLQLEWSVSPKDVELTVVLKKVRNDSEESSEGKAPIFEQKVMSVGGKGTLAALLQSPGAYEWELRRADRVLAKSAFILNRAVEGLEILKPLVGGYAVDSSQYNGELLKNFDITLRWKKYPTAKKYTVRLMNAPTATEYLLEREVTKEEYVLNKDKVYSGKIFYGVHTKLPSGFVVRSAPEAFIFDFKPPVLVLPADEAKVSRKVIVASTNAILLTWEKTNFTEGYELEVSDDAKFNRSLIKRRVLENFFVLKAPGNGKYWWRVRSYTKELLSPPSKPNAFYLVP